MTAKEYLHQAHNLNNLINARIQEKEELRQMAGRVRGCEFGERVQTSPSGDAPFVRIYEKMDLLERRITQEIDRLVDLKLEMEDAIGKLASMDEQLLLRYRYVSDCTWEQIGQYMNMSVRTVHRTHASALRNFVVPQKNEQN